MNLRGWIGAMMLLGGTACGPMPGYQMPHEEVPPAPRAPPAPAPTLPSDPAGEVDDRVVVRREVVIRREDDEDRYARDERDLRDDRDPADEAGEPADDRDEGELDETDEAPPVPAPRPPRYAPPPNWEPTPDPAKSPAPKPAPERPAAAPEPDRPDAIKIVRLDADSYYLIDPVRRLCFLRHKESMTAVDCAKIPEAGTPDRAQPATPSPAPVRAPEPSRMPEPSPAPATAPTAPPPPTPEAPAPLDEPAPPGQDGGPRAPSPSPDELTRFEGAFIAIYCDRKNRDATLPEARIREQGLTTVRYEAIEAWWAGDENAWYTLTTKASKACPR